MLLIKGIINKIKSFYFKEIKKVSYSQCGEDLVINYIFKALKINNPVYLDIGSNHPVINNNTYLLYKNKNFGVCIEPDPCLYKKLKRKRNKDRILNIGICGSYNTDQEADFFIMSSNTLNTFSEKIAEEYQKKCNQKIIKIVKIKLKNINNIIEEYFKSTPNLISIDTEGFDFEIIKSLDFDKYKPDIIIVETLTYSTTNLEIKLNDIIDFMINKGYFVYCDNYINTIFVNKIIWKNRIK